MNRTIVAALAVLGLLFSLVACGGSTPDVGDAVLTSEDVPAGWLAADLDDVAKGQALWDVLPDVLTRNTDARLILHAFAAESGLHGAATLLIETDAPTALPEPAGNDALLGPLGRLLVREDALLLADPKGGDPNAYFAVSDVPVPGAIRSRLIRLIDDDLVYSDSVTFNVGNVLAVVTVWYPKEEGPAGDLSEIASTVEARLQSVVSSS